LAYLTDGTNFDLDNKDMVDTFLMDLKIEVIGEELLLNGQNVTLRIRDEMVSMAASQVAKSQLVRDKMYCIQRNILSAPGLVADGRDMGTTVFPKAQLKIYLTASQQERAKRRHAQLVESGKHVKMEGLVNEMRERDAQDSSRDASPMKQAESAIEVDSTEKTIEEVVQIIVEIYQNLNGNPPL
jgi:cytidylate kinase